MKIRYAKPTDVVALANLEARSFPIAEAATADQIAKRVAAYGDHFWLLVDNQNQILAFVNGMVTDQDDLIDEMYERADWHQDDGKWQMIFSVVTDPDFRGSGLATQCLQVALDDAKSRGQQGAVLTCKDHLVGFYERFGFENEGFTGSTHGGVHWNQMRLRF